MRSAHSRILALLAVAGFIALTTPEASAQAPSGSLGGYSAASSYANPAMGGSSPMVIPYGGMTEGFMPSRMGGGNSLSYRSRPTAMMGSTRTSFSLSPLSWGMAQGTGTRMATPFGSSRGIGLGAGMKQGGPSLGGMGVMPRSIGYPFRQPPSFVPSSSLAAGMSM